MSTGKLNASQQILADELTELESQLDQQALPSAIKAKMFTCLAHDWFQMDDDLNGDRLLEKANKTCPGYFTNEVDKHRDSDSRFDTICKNIKQELMWIFLGSLKVSKNGKLN